jgi:Fic family protein
MFPYDSSRVRVATAELDEWKEKLELSWPLVLTWHGRLRRDLEAESVAASTRMEGVNVTADDVRRIFADDVPNRVSDEDADLVRGYREAMRFVLQRADDQAFEWDRGLLTNLQDHVVAGSEADGAGRFRRGETTVINQSTGAVVFEPPLGTDVPTLVDEMCHQVSASRDHPAITAAWMHIATAAIHPFRNGNGRTARILASLVMFRGGFRRPEFCSLEEWWGRHIPDYYAGFNCLGTQFDKNANVTEFIEMHVTAQLEQVRRLDLRERTESRIWAALEEIAKRRGLPERTANALWDAFNGRDITARYYKNSADIASRQTVTTDLNRLAASGLVRAVGERRGRRYLPAPGLYADLSNLLAIEIPPGATSPREVIGGRLAQRLLDSTTSARAVEVGDSGAGAEGTSVAVRWSGRQRGGSTESR